MSNPAVSGCLLLSGWKIGTITCKHGGNGRGATKGSLQGDAGLHQGPTLIAGVILVVTYVKKLSFFCH